MMRERLAGAETGSRLMMQCGIIQSASSGSSRPSIIRGMKSRRAASDTPHAMNCDGCLSPLLFTLFTRTSTSFQLAGAA